MSDIQARIARKIHRRMDDATANVSKSQAKVTAVSGNHATIDLRGTVIPNVLVVRGLTLAVNDYVDVEIVGHVPTIVAAH
jgi:hypothetical protein